MDGNDSKYCVVSSVGEQDNIYHVTLSDHPYVTIRGHVVNHVTIRLTGLELLGMASLAFAPAILRHGTTVGALVPARILYL